MPNDVIIRVLRYAGERPFVCARSCPSREMPDSTDSLSRFCRQDPGDLILILGKVSFLLAVINGREGLVLRSPSETVRVLPRLGTGGHVILAIALIPCLALQLSHSLILWLLFRRLCLRVSVLVSLFHKNADITGLDPRTNTQATLL